MRLSHVLLERDVANQAEIKEFIASLMDRTDKPNIKAWLKGSLKNYIVNTYQKTKPVKVTKSSPDWLVKKVEAGEEVLDVVLGTKFRKDVEHLIDYFTHSGEFGDKEIRVSGEDAFGKASIWGKASKAKEKEVARAKDGVDTIHEYDDGFQWVDVKAAGALKREGSRMGHCVGGYCDSVASGAVSIFSLRDPKNSPHVTVEIRKNAIWQIKGKGNERPVDKYIPYVNDLVTRLGLKVKSDLQNTDLVDSGNGYVDINNIPDGVEFTKHLDLTGRKSVKSLPDGLVVRAGLTISGTSIKTIQKSVKIVGGHVEAKNCDLESIEVEEFPADLILVTTKIEDLPKKLKVAGDLVLFENVKLTTLPEDLEVGGGLYTKSSPIKHLPEKLVAQKMTLNDVKIETYPKHIDAPEGELKISAGVKELPEAIRVAALTISTTGLKEISSKIHVGTLTIQGNGDLKKIGGDVVVTGLVSINKNRQLEEIDAKLDCKNNVDLSSNPKLTKTGWISSDGSVFLQGTALTQLNLERVSGTLDISGTKVTSLPRDLEVGKSLKLNDLVKTLGPIKVGGDVHTPIGAAKLNVDGASIGGKVKLSIMESIVSEEAA